MFKADAGGRRRLWMKLEKKLSNGVPVLLSVESIAKQRVLLKGKGDPTAIALQDWARGIKSGRKFSDVIGGWVTNEESMIITAGEQSGHIEKSLASASRVMLAKKEIRSEVTKGVIYPAFLIMMAIGVLLLFSYKIIPAFTNVVPNAKWSGMASHMMTITSFTRDYIVYVILLMIATIVAFVFSLPKFDGPVRIFLDRYPPYSIYRIVQGSSWLIAFSALIESGVRMENALQQLGDKGSIWLNNRMQACLRLMRAGYSIGDALARTGTDFPDREIIDDISVYGSMSGFDQALSLLGNEWITESVENIRAKMKVVFGAAILTMGGIVSFMVFGLFAMQSQMATAMRMAS